MLAPLEQGLRADSPSPCPACGPPAGSRHRPSRWLEGAASPLPKGAGWLCAPASDGTEGMARDCTVPVILNCYCRSQSKFESSPEAAPSLCKRTVRENSYCKACVGKRKKEFCNKSWLLWIHFQLCNYTIIYPV